MRLRGKTVLVTGASAGIGEATARALAQRGARVVLVARSGDKLAAIAAEIGGGAQPYACDVSDASAVAELAEQVKRDVGVPDVIVNNAGAGRWLFIEETDTEEFAAMTAVPYVAAFLVTRAFIGDMLARRSGHVVVVNSPVSYVVWPGALGYAGSRWALRGFTAALRSELRCTGVGVTEVMSGKVSSEYFTNNPGAEERLPAIVGVIPTLTPAQVARAICAGVERERRTVLTPLALRLILAQARFFPTATEWVLWRTGTRRTAIPADQPIMEKVS